MAYSPASPITGAAQTGLTSPTYTIASDLAPSANGKQYAVTALGGTQAGVRVHSPSDPFRVNFVRPVSFKAVQPVTAGGLLRNVGKNVWKLITGKGVLVVSGQPAQQMLVTTTIEVPAGGELLDPANVRAALSLHIGVLSAQSSGIGDSTVTGIV